MKASDLRGRLTVTVPEAGEVLGIGRGVAYRAAAAGEIPTLMLGRRLLVPVPKLLELVGASLDDLDHGPTGEVVPLRALPDH